MNPGEPGLLLLQERWTELILPRGFYTFTAILTALHPPKFLTVSAEISLSLQDLNQGRVVTGA